MRMCLFNLLYAMCNINTLLDIFTTQHVTVMDEFGNVITEYTV